MADALTRYWTPRRKESVVHDLLRGRTTFEAVKAEHDLSDEELSGWLERFGTFGRDGLKTTRLQALRLPQRTTERTTA